MQIIANHVNVFCYECWFSSLYSIYSLKVAQLRGFLRGGLEAVLRAGGAFCFLGRLGGVRSFAAFVAKECWPNGTFADVEVCGVDSELLPTVVVLF